MPDSSTWLPGTVASSARRAPIAVELDRLGMGTKEEHVFVWYGRERHNNSAEEPWFDTIVKVLGGGGCCTEP
ncbi:hypothetical protein JVU11DRAFT_1105 [Chiua virens]|nr:hypothetical protein JVU11DRAFT_1105 [Chiua virens]